MLGGNLSVHCRWFVVPSWYCPEAQSGHVRSAELEPSTKYLPAPQEADHGLHAPLLCDDPCGCHCLVGHGVHVLCALFVHDV